MYMSLINHIIERLQFSKECLMNPYHCASLINSVTLQLFSLQYSLLYCAFPTNLFSKMCLMNLHKLMVLY